MKVSVSLVDVSLRGSSHKMKGANHNWWKNGDPKFNIKTQMRHSGLKDTREKKRKENYFNYKVF